MKTIAIVTGASSGMGRECAIQLSDRFQSIDEIWVVSRRADRLEALKKQCSRPVRIIAGDLTDQNTMNEIFECLKSEKPRVRFLVNASGYGKIGPIGEISNKDETGMIDLNCKALTKLTHITLPYMISGSCIINFASAAAFFPQPEFAIYAATKAYVLYYSIALRRELSKKGIKVCAVCPGPVRTEFFNIAEEHYVEPIYKKIFSVKPEKVVAMAIRDAMRGKSTSVYGIEIKLLRIAVRILPWDLVMKFFKVR